ncbi:MAG: hypothetical protein IT303_17745 [Dehalococcoidia bacterium]|nr:hypothetical protein [Dehalococcoidia bacterium]
MTLEPPPLPEYAPLPPAPPARPAPVWRQGLSIPWRNRRAVLMPLVVTVLPVCILAGAAWLLLFFWAYPDAPYEATDFTEEAPESLLLWTIILAWTGALFTTVGYAATVVAVHRVLTGAPISLSASLDPAFTRMGGLLLTTLATYVLAAVAATIIGAVVVLYLMVRGGFAPQAYILENRSFAQSFRRSWSLVRGRMLALIGTTLVAVPLGTLVLLACALVFAIFAFPFDPEDPGRDATVVLNAFAMAVLGVALVPCLAYLATVTTVFYLDARKAADA